MRRFGATRRRARRVTAAARAAGLDVVGFGIHPPVAGSDDEHLDDIAAWLDLLEPDDEVWVSHLSRRRVPRPARRVARPPLPDPRRHRACGTATRRPLHLGADVLDVRAGPRPASTPATARASCPATARS